MAEMLEMQAKQIEAVHKYVAARLTQDKTGHDMGHIMRVVAMTEKICDEEKNMSVDIFVAKIGAYLHDLIDDKVVANIASEEKKLQEFLRDIALTDGEVKKVLAIIQNISFKNQLKETQAPLSNEAKVVQDADRLDAFGAIGIARAFYYGGHKGDVLYDPDIAPRTAMTVENYRQNATVMNHFYEKIVHLFDLLHTDYAKKIGAPRQELLLTYLTAFKKEWHLEA